MAGHATAALWPDGKGYVGLVSDQPDSDRLGVPGGQKFSWSCGHRHQRFGEARSCAQDHLDGEAHGSGAEGHRVVTLSLTTELADGGRLFRSWDLCECSTAPLAARLGPPANEALATAGQVQATAEAALRGGAVQL